MREPTVQQAKDFLARKLAAEAYREGAPLSELERRMLFYSVEDDHKPEIAALDDEFNDNYDQFEYEQKIGRLASQILARHAIESEDDKEMWDRSVAKLSEGDHYLSVLIAVTPEESPGFAQPSADTRKMVFSAVVALIVAIAIVLLLNRR